MLLVKQSLDSKCTCAIQEDCIMKFTIMYAIRVVIPGIWHNPDIKEKKKKKKAKDSSFRHRTWTEQLIC